MHTFEAKALEMIGDWNLRVKELEEKEAIRAAFREAILDELSRGKSAAITAERRILQSATSEVQRFLRVM